MRFKTKLLVSSLIVNVGLLSAPVMAQQQTTQPTEDTDEDTVVSDPAPGTGEGAAIVVTGTRIRQSTFNSPSPLQVLNAEEALKVGVTSVTELLQQSPQASGSQIDSQLNTSSGNSNTTEAPPTGGTGSSNIDLRGLGPERTLVLVNGRRFGSAGVRGAPSQPDISLLPLGLVERVDVITEGASAIYGADAVAGVVNVILKTDFEGLELYGGVQSPEHGGGTIEQFGATIGASGERARIMAGVEYYNRDRVRVRQRDFTRNGFRSIEEDENGTIYEVFRDGNFDNTLIDGTGSTTGGFPFFFYTPGKSDTGVPNFSSFANLPPVPNCIQGPAGCTARDRAPGGAGFVNFVYFPFYTDSDDTLEADLVQPLERFSFVASGSYDLVPERNIQAYFEAYYLERDQFIRAVNEQIFPDIPATIPVLDADGNQTGRVDNPLNPFDFDATPIITLDDLPQEFDVNVQQIRTVAGIQGDIPGDFFERRNWGFDVSWSYDKGTGFQSQLVLSEPNILAVTQGVFQNADGTLGCGLSDRIGQGGFFSLPACPLVNFFADSFYVGGPTGEGVFENDAQRDFLLGNRTNRTVIEQTMYSAFVNGGLFDIPFGGEVKFAAGYEHRDDEIDSQNSFLGVQGTNAAENPVAEGETIGKRNLDEVYAEIQVPLIMDRPFFDTLQFDGAVRYTDESNFGSETTYRVRGLWKPVSWVQLSGTYGTSYRAPNLREQFLADQGGGVGGGLDPCIEQNIDVAQNADPNSAAFQNLLANCIASGVTFGTDIDGDGDLDTALGSTGITTIPTSTGGNTDLLPETSKSWTATLALTPRISNAFTVNFAVSYYNIEIENSVRNLGAETVIDRCFNDLNSPGLTSPFCSFITRDTTAQPAARRLTNVRAGFVNIGQDKAEGIDFNARLSTNFRDLFGGPDAGFFIAASASRLLKRETQVFDESAVDELEGLFGLDSSGLPFSFPKWKGQATLGLEFDRFQLISQLTYIGEQTFEDADTLVFRANPFVTVNGVRPITRPVGGHLGSEIYQSLSLTYDMDDVSFTFGVRNLWDREPPIVDRAVFPARQNAVTSSGYDFTGRTFFINARAKM